MSTSDNLSRFHRGRRQLEPASFTVREILLEPRLLKAVQRQPDELLTSRAAKALFQQNRGDQLLEQQPPRVFWVLAAEEEGFGDVCGY